MEALKAQIELLREELNRSVIEDEYEVYYAKSQELDKLIAQYIDMTEN